MLSSGSHLLAFIRHTHGTLALLQGLVMLLPVLLRLAFSARSRPAFQAVLWRHFYAHTPVHKLQQQAADFCRTSIPQLLYTAAHQQLAHHQSAGHQILIRSHAPGILLASWCQQQGFVLIAPSATIQQNHYTGELQPTVSKLSAHFQQSPPKQGFAYLASHIPESLAQHCRHQHHLPLKSALRPVLFRTRAFWSPLLYRALQLLAFLLLSTLPFSISLHFFGAHQINLPAEPLLLLLAALSIVWYFLHPPAPSRYLRHPITLAGLFFLMVLLLTSFSSTMPLVSFKYTFIALLHWWVFFCTLPLLFHDRPQSWLRPFTWYSIPFCLILCYAWYQHAQYNFRIDVSVLTARPFYFDHALYSCTALLLLGPQLAGIAQRSSSRFGHLLLAVMLIIGLYFSFSRAAWLSTIAALIGTGLLFLLKPRFWPFMLMVVVGSLTLYFTTPILIQQLSKNQSPSKTESQADHLQSALNITSDPSNLERINRYSCAWRMFQDRPLQGFGPGTYQFAYLPYQRAADMTHISVTGPGPHRAGKGGGAHSEYLQALSESGALGLSAWLAIIFAFFSTTLRLIRCRIRSIQPLLLGVTFSLLTFFVHGLVNNFLHHDKIAALFWLLLAALMHLDVHQKSAQTA